MRTVIGVVLPLIYALLVYLGTRPPKPIYIYAEKTVITVTE